ncbi:hypothetical protein ACFL6N_03170 [Thermodesulfobacteriota bacterium]
MGIEKLRKSRWYEKYLPFIVKSPEMQVKWLVNAFRKGALSFSEITPYLRLLLSEDIEEKREEIIENLQRVDPKILEKMLIAAEIEDAPLLFGLITNPTIEQGVAMLRKIPPPYGNNMNYMINNLFQAIYHHNHDFFDQVVDASRKSMNMPQHFESAYERFREIVRDEELLSAMFPKAKS